MTWVAWLGRLRSEYDFMSHKTYKILVNKMEPRGESMLTLEKPREQVAEDQPVAWFDFVNRQHQFCFGDGGREVLECMLGFE